MAAHPPGGHILIRPLLAGTLAAPLVLALSAAISAGGPSLLAGAGVGVAALGIGGGLALVVDRLGAQRRALAAEEWARYERWLQWREYARLPARRER